MYQKRHLYLEKSNFNEDMFTFFVIVERLQDPIFVDFLAFFKHGQICITV